MIRKMFIVTTGLHVGIDLIAVENNVENKSNVEIHADEFDKRGAFS